MKDQTARQAKQEETAAITYSVMMLKSGTSTAYGFGASTLRDAINRITRTTMEGIYTEIEYLTEICAHCGGTGRVESEVRLYQWKACPVCKGKNSQRELIGADSLV